eukprot:4761476-Pleurochrysis_carterae.AAC.2
MTSPQLRIAPRHRRQARALAAQEQGQARTVCAAWRRRRGRASGAPTLRRTERPSAERTRLGCAARAAGAHSICRREWRACRLRRKGAN